MPKTCQAAVLLVVLGATHGSAFLVSRTGLAMTAHHVIEGADSISVRDHAGTEHVATVAAQDRQSDSAIIRLPPGDYPCLPIGRSSKHLVGKDVYAIGAPKERQYAHSVSRGIVSGVRVINGTPSIQTDAAINPGNRRGPLITRGGQVVGIVTFKRRQAEGMSFGVTGQHALQRLSPSVSP